MSLRLDTLPRDDEVPMILLYFCPRREAERTAKQASL